MEPETIFTRRHALRLLGASALVPLVPGCARLPSGAGAITGSGPQITVSMTVRGQILQNSIAGRNFYYFFLFNLTDNPTDPGPIPVITAPFGNGFAAPNNSTNSQGGRAQGFVGFVLYCPVIVGAIGYGLYTVPANPAIPGQLMDVTTLSLNGGFIGPTALDSYTPVLQNGSVLSFRLSLNRLPYPTSYGPVTSPSPSATPTPTPTPSPTPSAGSLPRSLQFNILTTDDIPQGGDVNVEKLWDALGNGLQAESTNTDTQLAPYVVIDLTQNTSIDNLYFSATPSKFEVAGDVYNQGTPANDADYPNDPNLDIVDWSLQVTTG